MTFTDKQKAELSSPLDRKHVAQRTQSGRSMSYIEGWHAIAEANRIFGFDGWNRETISMEEVRSPELVKSRNGGETWRVGFICKVRVTVGDVVREGTGYGSGALPDLGEAYESAVKEAETDAMKRALMTFGNPFGLALYDKTQSSVADVKPEPAQEPKQSEPKSNRLSKEKARDLYARMQKDLNDTANEGPDAITSLMKSDEMVNDLASLPEDWERTLVEDAKSLYRAAKTFFEENEGPKQLDAAAYLKQHFPGSQEMKGN